MGRKATVVPTAEIQILESLRKSPNGDGLWQNQVVTSTGLSRTHVNFVAKKLEKDGKIKINRTGNRAKYALTFRAFEELIDSSSIFSEEVISQLLIANVRSVPVQLEVSNASAESYWERLYEYYTPQIRKQQEESMKQASLALTKFSTKVGALITYTIIHAVFELYQKGGKKSISDYEKERFVKDSVNKMFDILSERILRIFTIWFSCRITYDVKSRTLPSRYEFNESTVNGLMYAFRKSFPDIADVMKDIESNMQSIIENKKRETIQRTCSHNFKLAIKGKKKIKTCLKCKYEYEESTFLSAKDS